MNPLKAITATVRLLALRRRGGEVLALAEQAAKAPRLYRDPTWWSRLFTAARGLADALPMPQEARTSMQNTVLKLTVLAGAAVSIIGQLAQPEVLAALPPKVQAYVLSAASIAAIVAGILHPAPSKPQQQ
jgi:hypothetical protein